MLEGHNYYILLWVDLVIIKTTKMHTPTESGGAITLVVKELSLLDGKVICKLVAKPKSLGSVINQ